MTTHRVNCVEIELDTDDERLARTLMSRIGTLRERRIVPVLDRVMSEHSGPERLDRIDTLELDLGAIEVDGFEDAFVRRLEESLREALRRHLSGSSGSTPPWRRSMELVEVYARTGNLPWWADARPSDAVGVELRALVRDVPREVIELLARLDDDGRALSRVAACGGPTLVSTLAEVLGSPALNQQLEEWWGANGLRAATLDDRVAQLRVIAQYRSEPRGRASAGSRAAASTPASAPAARSEQPGRWSPAGGSEREPAREAEPSTATPGPTRPPPRDFGSALPRRSTLGDEPPHPRTDGVRSGTDPRTVSEGEPLVPGAEVAPGAGPPAQNTLRSDAAARPDAGPAAQVALRPEAAADSGSAAQVARRSDAAVGAEPPAAQVAHRSDAAVTSNVVPRASPASLTGADAWVDRRAGGGASTRDATAIDRTAPRASRRAVSRPDAPPRVARARRAALESLEQLYLDDAGLVILWPFLPRFLSRVGLLDADARFIDEDAPMRAIALLEFLAAAEPDPPEYRLPLAKLLCGVAPDEPYVLPSPLEPPMLDEAEHLLRSVIAQVPLLGEMTIPSFRASFLRREGALTTPRGTWSLQVTRQTHDVVLERFGWSWAWVKLPWMPDPLQVEW